MAEGIRLEDIGPRRERALRRLKRVLADNPRVAREAAGAVIKEFDEHVERTNLEKRRSVTDTLALLEIGKACVVNPRRMRARSGEKLDIDKPPDGFDPLLVRFHRKPSRRVSEAFRAVGRYDLNVAHALENIIGHLRNARRVARRHKFDFAGSPAIDSYVLGISAVWAEGKMSPEQVRAELDPCQVTSAAATREMGLFHAFRKELDSSADQIITAREAWRRAVILLFACDPEFDGGELGLRPAIPWKGRDDDQNWMAQRSVVVMMASMADIRAGATTIRATAMLESVCEQLETFAEARVRQQIGKPSAVRGPRRKLPLPSPTAVQSALSEVQQAPSGTTYTPQDIIQLYQVDVTVGKFTHSGNYVARDGKQRVHQLPWRTTESDERSGGRFESAITWTREEVLAAIRGWATKLGMEGGSPF